MAVTVTEIKGTRQAEDGLRGSDVIVRRFRVNAEGASQSGNGDEFNYRSPQGALQHPAVPAKGETYENKPGIRPLEASGAANEIIHERPDMIVQRRIADFVDESRFISEIILTYGPIGGGSFNEFKRRWRIGVRTIQVDTDLFGRAVGSNVYKKWTRAGQPVSVDPRVRDWQIDPDAVLTKDLLIATPALQIEQPQGRPAPPLSQYVRDKIVVAFALMTKVNSTLFEGVAARVLQYIGFEAFETSLNQWVFAHEFVAQKRVINGVEIWADMDYYWTWSLDIETGDRTPHQLISNLVMYEQADFHALLD